MRYLLLTALLLLPLLSFASEGKGETVRITADRILYDYSKPVVIFEGRVQAWYGSSYFEAERLTFYPEDHYVVAEGKVLLKEGGDILRASRMEFNTETKEGVLYEAKIFLKRRHFHITGDKIEKLGEMRYRVHRATLTSCDQRVPPWKFTCRRLDVEVEGYAKGWWPGFMVKDIPVLYLPWAIFPVKKERQTGFLIPSFSVSDKYGPILTVPFYWAIAKNQDATFYLTRYGDARGRGFKGGVEYRYALSSRAQGDFRLFYLYDEVEDRNRWAFFSNQRYSFPKGYGLMADVNLVSDEDYPSDFSEDLEREALIEARSKNQLRSVLYLWKGWEGAKVGLEFSYFRDLNVSDNDATLQRLPRATLEVFKRPLFRSPLFWELSAEGTHFWREEGVRGGRFDLEPKVSMPTRPFGVLRFEPWASLRGTLYVTDDPKDQIEDYRSRGLYEFGVSLSTSIARIFFPKGGGITALGHLLEPKVLYHWRPKVDQDRNPYYDASDRLDPESLLTFELLQRFTAKIGEERRDFLYLKVSQPYDFYPSRWRDRLKDLKVELSSTPLKGLRLKADAEFDHHHRRFDAFNAAASLIYKGLEINAEYRFERHQVEEVNFLGGLKALEEVDLWVSHRYNLLADYRVETVYGIRYRHQCWEVALSLHDIGRSPDGTQRAEWKVMVEVTLTGIGTFKVR